MTVPTNNEDREATPEQKAWDELARLTSGGGPAANWKWSIPANPDRDSDLILAAGLKALADERDALLAARRLPATNEDREALTTIRDAYERTMDMRPVCDDDFYAAVQEALNRVCDSDGNFIARRLPVSGDTSDRQRIAAWDRVAQHPIFASCYAEERPLIESVLDRLTALEASQPREVEVTDEAFAMFVQSFNGDEAGDIDDVGALDGATGWAMRGGNDVRAVFEKAAAALGGGDHE